MTIAHVEFLLAVECQKCWALWTYHAGGVPPSQGICRHGDEFLLMRDFKANGEAKPYKVES